MVCQVDEIAKDVRIALDRNMSSDRLAELGDVDTLSLDQVIISKIAEAVERVHSEAPSYLLESGHNFGGEVYWGKMGSGQVLLPDDFMRLILFKMSDWSRPVYHAISEEEPEYSLQSSRFRGIRGTAQKPVCGILIKPEGKVLEFYSSKGESATVEAAVYLPYPTIDPQGGIEICNRCYTGVVYTISSLVLSAYGDNGSAIMSDLAKTVLK